jgi:hypothetical protein
MHEHHLRFEERNGRIERAGFSGAPSGRVAGVDGARG